MLMKKMPEMGFEGVTNNEFGDVCLHRELAGSDKVLSKQKHCIGFWEA